MARAMGRTDEHIILRRENCLTTPLVCGSRHTCRRQRLNAIEPFTVGSAWPTPERNVVIHDKNKNHRSMLIGSIGSMTASIWKDRALPPGRQKRGPLAEQEPFGPFPLLFSCCRSAIQRSSAAPFTRYTRPHGTTSKPVSEVGTAAASPDSLWRALHKDVPRQRSHSRQSADCRSAHTEPKHSAMSFGLQLY